MLYLCVCVGEITMCTLSDSIARLFPALIIPPLPESPALVLPLPQYVLPLALQQHVAHIPAVY